MFLVALKTKELQLVKKKKKESPALQGLGHILGGFQVLG